MTRLNLQFITAICFLTLMVSSCVEEGNPFIYQEDAHGRGKQDFYFEESFKPLFETTIQVFESQFPKADIVPHYCTEKEAIAAFLEGKTHTIAITRDFTDAERVKMRRNLIECRTDAYAKDGIALIINPENQDSTITVQEIKDVLLGKKEKWETNKTTINVVFDAQNSANHIYLNNLIKNKKMSKNVFALKSNEEVIEYVKTHRDAIGVIGVNWISDIDDQNVVNFLKDVKIMSVAATSTSSFYKPFQAYIYTDEYPLTRSLYLINKGKRSGLNTGFVIFLTGDQGQLIVQKSSLVPSNSPVRLINFVEQ